MRVLSVESLAEAHVFRAAGGAALSSWENTIRASESGSAATIVPRIAFRSTESLDVIRVKLAATNFKISSRHVRSASIAARLLASRRAESALAVARFAE